MARETIERVQKCEEEALEIVAKAEREASELLARAGSDADGRLKALKEEEAKKMHDAIADAEDIASGDFETFKSEVFEKCKNRRDEILSGGEKIIGRIIEAVKKG